MRTCDDVPAACTAHHLLARLRVVLLQQPHHLGVVGHGGTVPGGGEGDGQVHPGVVVLPLGHVKERRNRGEEEEEETEEIVQLSPLWRSSTSFRCSLPLGAT